MKSKEYIDAISLGIDLVSKNESQTFRWFLACLLFGKPIQQEIARRAYVTITAAYITTINKLVKTDWDTLVKLLDKAHYVRYDLSTATKLLQISKAVKEEYGTISRLLKQSTDVKDLEERLTAFRGIGPVTASIFIRGITPVWFKGTVSHDYESATKAAKNPEYY
jgi:endonuclease III